MTTSIFKDFDAFNKALSHANVSLGWDKSSLVTDTLTIQKKGGFFRGLKIIFLSIFRPFGYDQFSHLKTDKIANTLLNEVKFFCKTGKMNSEAMDKVALILTRLNQRTKGKYADKICSIAHDMETLSTPVEKMLKDNKEQRDNFIQKVVYNKDKAISEEYDYDSLEIRENDIETKQTKETQNLLNEQINKLSKKNKKDNRFDSVESSDSEEPKTKQKDEANSHGYTELKPKSVNKKKVKFVDDSSSDESTSSGSDRLTSSRPPEQKVVIKFDGKEKKPVYTNKNKTSAKQKDQRLKLPPPSVHSLAVESPEFRLLPNTNKTDFSGFSFEKLNTSFFQNTEMKPLLRTNKSDLSTKLSFDDSEETPSVKKKNDKFGIKMQTKNVVRKRVKARRNKTNNHQLPKTQPKNDSIDDLTERFKKLKEKK